MELLYFPINATVISACFLSARDETTEFLELHNYGSSSNQLSDRNKFLNHPQRLILKAL